MSDLPIVPLSSDVRVGNYDAGNEALTDYLRKYAGQNQRKGIGRTYVLVNGSFAVGYYTVSMSEIAFMELPDSVRKRVPRYPVPAMRIGRLSVHVDFRGKGLGEALLVDALQRAVALHDQIGMFAIVVDAKDASAKRFYQKYGFLEFSSRPLSLFLPISTAAKGFNP